MKEILKRAELIGKKIDQLCSSYLSSEFLPGDRKSNIKGGGIEFQEYRPYQPGDNFFLIDWKASKRSGVLVVKTHRSEKTFQNFILVDASMSMRYFQDMLWEITAILGLVSLRSREKLSVIKFCERDYEKEVFLRKENFFGFLGKLQAPSFFVEKREADLSRALSNFANLEKTGGKLVFILSDFMFPSLWRKELAVLSCRSDVVPIIFEQDLKLFDYFGAFELEDVETFSRFTFNSDQRGHVEGEIRKLREEQKEIFRLLGVDYFLVRQQDDFLEKLVYFFLKRGGK